MTVPQTLSFCHVSKDNKLHRLAISICGVAGGGAE